jgi:hypothetical protein
VVRNADAQSFQEPYLYLREFEGSHSDVSEDLGFLRCEVASFKEWFLTVQWHIPKDRYPSYFIFWLSGHHLNIYVLNYYLIIH